MRKGTFYGLSKCLIVSAFLIFEILLAPPETISSPLSKGKQDQIKEIESKLSREKQKLKAFDFQEKDLLVQLADLEKMVTDARRSVNELEKTVTIFSRSASWTNRSFSWKSKALSFFFSRESLDSISLI